MTSYNPLDLERRWIDIRKNIPHFGPPRIRDLSKLKYLVVHHTASHENTTPAELAREAFLKFKWDGISYHFLVYQNGDIYLARNPVELGACVELKNTPSLCVACVGNFSEQTPSDAMIQTLADFAAWALACYQTIELVCRHSHFKVTECPGVNFPWQSLASAIRERMRGVPRVFTIEGGEKQL